MSVVARLVVKGFVQGIGYRAHVKQCAYRLKVRGTVKNLPDGSVEIYCNAPSNEVYEKFKMFIREAPGAEIDEIEEHFEGTEGYGTGPEEWLGFNILRDELSSIEETLDYVVLGGIMIRDEIKKLSEKQDKMLEKQDETLKAIKDMHNDMNSRFDWLAERYGEFGQTMRELKEDMREIKNDIHEMKEAFVKLTEHFTKK